METNLIGLISIGITLGIFALICWIIWRLSFKQTVPAPETKAETKKEKEKKPVTPRSKSKAATIFFLLLISVALMIAHQIYTDRRATKIQVRTQVGRPLTGISRMPTAITKNPDGSWRVPVSANRLEVDSTLEVKKGQKVTITATGQVNGCKIRYDAAYGWTDPEGWKWTWDKRRKRRLGQGTRFMALCTKIGENGQWFLVGKGLTFTAPRLGQLFFGVNEDIYDPLGRLRLDWTKDNEGSFIVTIKLG